MKIEFSWPIFEKYSNIKFNKIRLVGAELFCAGGRTDMTKLIFAFYNFPNAPEKGTCPLFSRSEFPPVYMPAYVHCVNGTWNKAWYAAFNSRRCVLHDSALLTKFISHRWFVNEWIWGTDGNLLSWCHLKSRVDWRGIGPSRWDAGD